MDFLSLFGQLACILPLDMIFIISAYQEQIKKKGLIREFKSWEGTYKPLIWFISWSIIISANLLVYVLFWYVLPENKKSFLVLFFIAVVFYGLFIWFIYVIIKSNIKYYQAKKKDKESKTDESDDNNSLS